MKNLSKHPSKKSTLMKFFFLLCVLIAYFFFVSYKFGLDQGFAITALTWSFFVLCTPIADAGFLLDFPVRLITNFKMLHTEILVWVIAISLNLYFVNESIGTYDKTFLLGIFKHILLQPVPYWSIIFLSVIGTFLSVYFGDEVFDVIKDKERRKYFLHKEKYELIVFIFLIAITVVVYNYLLQNLGIHLL